VTTLPRRAPSRPSIDSPTTTTSGWPVPRRTVRRIWCQCPARRRAGRQADLTRGPAKTSIESVILEVPDPTVANAFYTTAFGLGTQVGLLASEAPTTGFRGLTLSLRVSQPATVSGLIGAALDPGATPLKPAAKSLWGYSGVVQAPDGTIWKVATSTKKDTGPATRQIDDIVLLLGVADVAARMRLCRPRPRRGEELWPQARPGPEVDSDRQTLEPYTTPHTLQLCRGASAILCLASFGTRLTRR
jgi:hypothetical protein